MRYFFDFFLTFFKSAGAANGPGIYLGKGSGISSSYTRCSSSYWKNSINKAYTCMAICEVINDSSGFTEYPWGYVVTNENLLVNRTSKKISLNFLKKDHKIFFSF